ncbi:ABC transporter substrate-binding protein [Leifsonia aquatica]|uniref:ABC transporter, solute-binding protein n=3 Tax=Leifsonia aquatica TaxID=144185 RepID=U2T4S4_LEIAQ|nr:ABC transporter substrate-binding protein [Leifsonia aquatica]ERK72453.1 ABC transporter, solute-binding protein [Leifsonia aquatica ATCC 14665]MBB2965274.1 multiple sugar transport system substrate-binding protein [Leifsonia aquatica]
MKKLLATLAAAAGVSLALAGCSGSSGTDSSGPVTLTFWHGYTEADGKVLDQIVDDFNKSQDKITIKTTTKTWAVIGDTLLPALSAKKGPDIVAMPAENLPVYASKGAFAKLDDFYSSDATKNASLNPSAVEMEKVDGSYYGVPTGFVPLSVIYNKTLFDKAGISSFPTTWDEWVADAKKLTVDEDGDGTPEQYGLALPDHATVGNGVWASLFYGNGGEIVDGSTSALDSKANTETLTYWADAVRNGKISPTGLDGVASDKLFSSGKAAMEIGGPWMASVATENKIDYGIAGIPAGPKSSAASAIGISAAVTAQADSTKKAAAEKFFDYFFTKEVATKWSLGSGWPPLRTDIPSSAVASNPVVASLTDLVGDARPLLPGVANSTDVLSAVDEATQKALTGGDPADLLKSASSQVQQALGN